MPESIIYLQQDLINIFEKQDADFKQTIGSLVAAAVGEVIGDIGYGEVQTEVKPTEKPLQLYENGVDKPGPKAIANIRLNSNLLDNTKASAPQIESFDAEFRKRLGSSLDDFHPWMDVATRIYATKTLQFEAGSDTYFEDDAVANVELEGINPDRLEDLENLDTLSEIVHKPMVKTLEGWGIKDRTPNSNVYSVPFDTSSIIEKVLLDTKVGDSLVTVHTLLGGEGYAQKKETYEPAINALIKVKIADAGTIQNFV